MPSLGRNIYVGRGAGVPAVWNPVLGYIDGNDGKPLNFPRDENGLPLDVQWNPGRGSFDFADGSNLVTPRTMRVPAGAGGQAVGGTQVNWSGNPVVGDSYGGVQSADQARINSDRNFQMALIQAQQMAQKIALDEQHAQVKDQLAARGLDIQESANTDKADYQKALLDLKSKTTADSADTASRFGNSVLGPIADALDLLNNSNQVLGNERQKSVDIQTAGDRMIKDGLVSFDPKKKSYVDGPNAGGGSWAAKLNEDVRQNLADAKKAQDAQTTASRGLANLQSLVQRNGFVIDPNTQTLSNAKYGLSLSYGQKQAKLPAPSVRYYNPSTGKFQ